MNSMKFLINEIDKLKPASHVLNKVMELMNDSQRSSSELSEVIVYDPALTANILKACNSAYFGLKTKIDSIQHAITFLGMEEIAELVLLCGCSDEMLQKQEGYDLRKGELWRASVSSAIIARDIAKNNSLNEEHFIFTAALLKDIGKIVLNQYVAGSLERINELVFDQGYSFIEAEKDILGIDHAELGAIIARRWQFSDKMVEVIHQHHLSEEPAKNIQETTIVYLSDIICMMMGIGVGSDGLAYNFHKEAFEQLGLSDQDIQKIILNFAEKIEKVEALISLP